jgi:hypothetical protein
LYVNHICKLWIYLSSKKQNPKNLPIVSQYESEQSQVVTKTFHERLSITAGMHKAALFRLKVTTQPWSPRFTAQALTPFPHPEAPLQTVTPMCSKPEHLSKSSPQEQASTLTSPKSAGQTNFSASRSVCPGL